MISPEEISSRIPLSYQRIKPYIISTRLVKDPVYGCWLKCENEQKTGSFKWRGALSKLSLLEAGQDIVTASTGNHGLAVANASGIFGLNATIYVPASASAIKVDKIRKTGAKIIQVEGDSLSAELAGKKFAADNNLPWISPYNDADVIAGQGTIGIELMEAIPEIDRAYITVGGGGLISGIASFLKKANPDIEIIGCQPQNSPEMYLSILEGQVVTAPDAKDTLSDGSAGPLEEDSITFPLCRQLIDRFMLISESEIENALRYVYDKHHMVIEGSAGVAMAGAMKEQKSENSVVILCGGNIDERLHQSICNSH